ncbi:hypothetical protein KC19_10G180800 [Ceratodon purpureus]|uniref:Uncharacterized protein n=1 Tax=Ceratodon purpureus TaxID=3225 RepID=A0A8T0GQ84_CERPU|nr:hypothetical protein KC19_10G180800 [Ceratodon purpureus]
MSFQTSFILLVESLSTLSKLELVSSGCGVYRSLSECLHMDTMVMSGFTMISKQFQSQTFSS